MKNRIVSIFICILILLPAVSLPVQADTAQPPEIRSGSAVVIDLDSGRILYENSKDEHMEPAGLSKLVTAYLALERLSLKDSLTVTAEDMKNVPDDATTIGLEAGNHLTVEDAVNALLLGSSTEASVVLSRAISGSEDAFVKEMNSFAAGLSCSNTSFKNSYGLPADGQYTSASDMALIAREVYKNDELRHIMTSESYVFSDALTFWNSNRMLYGWDELYYGACTGGKNGYIEGFGGDFICYAEKDGIRLAAVVMQADQAEIYYDDARSLLEYVFSSFSPCYPLAGFQMEQTNPEGIVLNNYCETLKHDLPSYSFSTGISFLLPSGTSPDDVEKKVVFYDSPKGSTAGYISCYYKGNHLGDVPLYLTAENIGSFRFKIPESVFTSASYLSGNQAAVGQDASPGNASSGEDAAGNAGNPNAGNTVDQNSGYATGDQNAGNAGDQNTGNASSNTAKEKKNSHTVILVVLGAVGVAVLAGLIWLFHRIATVKKEREMLQKKSREMMERRKQELSLEEEDDDE